MSQLVVASFHYLIFSHLGANMPNGTLYVSSRVGEAYMYQPDVYRFIAKQ